LGAEDGLDKLIGKATPIMPTLNEAVRVRRFRRSRRSAPDSCWRHWPAH
jgi:hypothetical protein